MTVKSACNFPVPLQRYYSWLIGRLGSEIRNFYRLIRNGASGSSANSELTAPSLSLDPDGLFSS